MITKFKIFEGTLLWDWNELGISKLLCINNRIGELTDEYDLTIGKLYNIDKNSNNNVIVIVDDSGYKIFFDPRLIYRAFSTDQDWEEYQLNQATNKYNL